MNAKIKILQAKTRSNLTLAKQVANFAEKNRKNKVAWGIGALGIFGLLSEEKKRKIGNETNTPPSFM